MRRILLTFLCLFTCITVTVAQSFPTPEEIRQVLVEGPEWKVYKLKNQMLSAQAELDKESSDYQIINLTLLSFYYFLEDYESLKRVAEELYEYLNDGGDFKLKEYCDINGLYRQVTFSLISCYEEDGDYAKAEEIGAISLKYAKQISNYDYYETLSRLAEIQHKLGKSALAYKNIQECYKKFDNTNLSQTFSSEEWKELVLSSGKVQENTNRRHINIVFFTILRDLAAEAISKADYRSAKKYFKEINKIFKDYPETNTAVLIDYELFDLIVECFPKNAKLSEIEKTLEPLMNLKQISSIEVLKNESEEWSIDKQERLFNVNDYFARNYLSATEYAISNKRYRAADIFISLAERYANHEDVSSESKEFVLDYGAYCDGQIRRDYIAALNKNKELIKIREQSNEEDLKITYLNLLNLIEHTTICNRYFYTHEVGTFERRAEENYIPYVSTDDVSILLDAWEDIANGIIRNRGIEYFNSLISSFRDTPSNQRVFPLYSIEDTELMRGHNHIRNKQYDEAFSIFRSLIKKNSFNDDRVIDLIWRIDNNLYLHSDYESANSFLSRIQNVDFVSTRPNVREWVSWEIERIKDWASYAIGYAQSLSNDGKIDEAMEEYDLIDEQVNKMEGRDSLLVMTNLYRATDLKSAGQFTEAIPYYNNADSLYTTSGLKSFQYRHFTLNGLSWCYYNCKDLPKAMVYIDADCSFIENYSGDTGESDYETEWHSAHKQRATIYLEQKLFDQAATQYLLLLKRLESRGVNSTDHEYKDVVCWIAQTYYEASIALLESSNEGFLVQYDKSIDFLDAHKDIEEAYIFINPLNDCAKEIISKINESHLLDFCDKAIQFDNKRTDYKLQNGIISEQDAIRQEAFVISQIAFDCFEAKHYNEAILYYYKSIDIIQKNIHSFSHDFMTLYYSMIASSYQFKGEWEKAVDSKIRAFYSSVDFNGIDGKSSKEVFRSIEVLISIALAASTSYANAIYHDENHPHLDYETNIAILSKWKELLISIKEEYGQQTINGLQEYCLQDNADWRRHHGTERPYVAEEKLTYESRIYYILCKLNIMGNRMDDFSKSYRTLLEHIVSIDPSDDVNLLRYDIVMQMSKSLSHAGYSDWSMEVLMGYWQYLVSEENRSFDYAEKVTSAIGFEAWRMNDIDRLIWATTKASLLLNNEHGRYYRYLFYDVNELISQLILYSRVQAFSSLTDTQNTLKYAMELVDLDVSITGNDRIKSYTTTLLYNEFATVTYDPNESIKYLSRALDIDNNNDYSVQLNLAGSYSKIGEYEKSDSLLNAVYNYSKEKYMEPRWIITLYKYLTENAIQKGDVKKARDYSKECLSVQIQDYLKASQALTSKGRNNYWDLYYNQTLEDATSVDYSCGSNGENSYNAALFQKSILIRQKRQIKNNILQSSDLELKQAFEHYNNELRALSDSAAVIESYCMYLYSLHPEFISTFIIPQWQEVKSSLKKDELAIEYSLAHDEQTGESFYTAILLRNMYDMPIIVRLCTRDELINAATGQMDENGFPISLHQDNTVLYRLIWEPIEKFLKGVKTIYYVPYEYLNNINIEIASKREGGRSIGDTYTMFRVSTTAELANTDNTYYTTATIFGSLDYNAKIVSSETPLPNNNPTPIADYAVLRGSMGGSWSRLANTKREMEDIQIRLNLNNIRTTVYGEDRGTEEAFKGLSGVAPDIIHMATHGFYYSVDEAQNYQFFTSSSQSIYSSGLRSGLVLSGGNHAWNGEPLPIGVEDGILTADEISGMDLTGTQMLTLSACQTALGDIASDGIYGMQRSFKVSGVNTIIMSLWQVDDEATYLMMDRFYQELTSGKEKHIAFRLAQLSIRPWAEKRVKELREEIEKLPQEAQEKRIKQYGGRLYPEYYWGAFVMLD